MNALLTLCLLFTGTCLGAAGPLDPGLTRELSALKARGFEVQRIITDTAKDAQLSAVLLRDRKGGLQKLNVYAQVRGRTFMVYTHPSSVDRLEFSKDMLSDREFSNLLRDGSRTIAYHATTGGLERRVLYILRCSGLKVRRAAAFPEGSLRDLDDDGRLEVVSRSLPLGRFFSTGCEEFQTMAQTAFQTRVFAWRDGEFLDVSARYPSYFDADIARLKDSLALIPKERRPGEYLGESIATYFDYAAKGEQRQGWQRLSELLKPPAVSLPRVTQCLESVKADLRQKLEIPPDW